MLMPEHDRAPLQSLRPKTRNTLGINNDLAFLGQETTEEDPSIKSSVVPTDDQMESAFPPPEMNFDRSLGENSFSNDYRMNTDPTIEVPTISFMENTTEDIENNIELPDDITKIVTDIETDFDGANPTTPNDKAAELGYILRERFEEGPRKIISGLTQQENLDIINNFYTQALGPNHKQDASNMGTAWCAAFVNHILTQLGADTLGKGKDGKYNRLRANAYQNYGTPIFNRNDSSTSFGDAQEGDLVLLDIPKPNKETGEPEYDGIVDHVGFFAGNRLEQAPNFAGGFPVNQDAGIVNVLGGNQAPRGNYVNTNRYDPDNTVSVNAKSYPSSHVLGIRRITYGGDAWQITQEQKDADIIFKNFDTRPDLTGGFSPSTDTTYAQGGLTSMNNQTQMAFALGGDTQGMAETVDPISGNDVPPGSLPVEVRDDIDAKLSEGEYVVPADVVRFFGVKLFEDLRAEAKMGLQKMNEDGRIGGEPVPMDGPAGVQEDMALNGTDVDKLEQMFSTGVADGGLIDKIVYTVSNDKTINNRMNERGISIGFAEGGLNVGAEPTQIDLLIDKAIQNPKIMKMVADKIGTAKSTTTANLQPSKMQDSNPTEEIKKNTIKANEGGFMSAYSEGGIELGYNPYEYKSKLDSSWLSGASQDITLTLVIGPDGVEIPLWLNPSLPLPDGYRLVSEVNAETAASNAASNASSDQDRQDKRDAERAANAPKPKPFDYKNATDQELADLMAGNVKMQNASTRFLMSPAAPIALLSMWGINKTNTLANEELKRRLVITEERGLDGRSASIKNVLDGKNSNGNPIDTRGPLSRLFNIPVGEFKGLVSGLDRIDYSLDAVEGVEDGTGQFEDLDIPKGTLTRSPVMIKNPNYAGGKRGAEEFIPKTDSKGDVIYEDDSAIRLDGAKVDTKNALAFNQEEQQFDAVGNPIYKNTRGAGNFIQESFWSLFSGTGETYGAYVDRTGIGGTEEYTGSGKNGVGVGKISGQNDAGEKDPNNVIGVVVDKNNFVIKASDIFPNRYSEENKNFYAGNATVYKDKGGYAFTKNFLGKTTYLKDDNNDLIKDFDVNDNTKDSDSFASAVMNPAGMSRNMYQEALDAGMNPKNAPDFGEDWVAVKNPNSNTWGKRWKTEEERDSPSSSPSSSSSSSSSSLGSFASAEAGRIARSQASTAATNAAQAKEDKSDENRAKREAEAQAAADAFQEEYDSSEIDSGEFAGADYDYSYGNKGGLFTKPKKSYKKGGYVTDKKTKQRKSGLASRL